MGMIMLRGRRTKHEEKKNPKIDLIIRESQHARQEAIGVKFPPQA